MYIEVAYAEPRSQRIVELDLPEGCTARDAAIESGLDAHFDGLDLSCVPLGVFGKKVSDQQALSEGDRVELYRPLQADPKAARRARAEKKANADKS